jgi:hypothetical protein
MTIEPAASFLEFRRFLADCKNSFAHEESKTRITTAGPPIACDVA